MIIIYFLSANLGRLKKDQSRLRSFIDKIEMICKTLTPNKSINSKQFKMSSSVIAENLNMERWQNKIAVVTGASAGIGAATCKALVEKGMIVVGLARRVDKMENQTRPLIAVEYQKNFHTQKCDVGDEESVKAAFAWIKEKFGGIDVLINNAGICPPSALMAPDNSVDVKNILNTNVLGVVWCTREAFRSMKERDVDGHVVIINSIAGHRIPNIPGFSFHMYAPSKHAVTAMTEVLRQEFLTLKTKVKVTVVISLLPFE